MWGCGGGQKKCVGGGLKQKLIMMLLWMDVTHANRHVSEREGAALISGNSGGVSRERKRERERGRVAWSVWEEGQSFNSSGAIKQCASHLHSALCKLVPA